MSKHPCLLFHGFTGGPYELQPLADYLQKQGRACEVPRLRWHGESGNELDRTHWTDWLTSAERTAEAFTKRNAGFDLIGFSMGGLLAAYLASRFPVRRLVLLNAAVIYVSPGRLLQMIKDDWKGGGTEPLSKVNTTPLRATWQFTRLVRHLKPEIAKVTVPTFIAQSERDQVIHPYSARYVYNKLTGYRELNWYAKSNHLICLGEEAPALFRQVSMFLEKE